MKRHHSCRHLAAIVAGGIALAHASAQSPAAPAAFEAASVKPAAPAADLPPLVQQIMDSRGLRQQSDPGQIRYPNATLQQLLLQAFAVKEYQIAGPAWLKTKRFEVIAKLPEGALPGQEPAMLQTLLTERFQIKLHRETRQLPVYNLVVANGGPKMVAAAPNATEPATPEEMQARTAAMRKQMEEQSRSAPGGQGDAGAGASAPGGSPPAAGGTEDQSGLQGKAADAMQAVLAGALVPNKLSIASDHETMDQLATALSGAVDRPVLNLTHLDGAWAVKLTYAPAGASGGTAPTPFAAVQDQLGLKLEPAIATVEVLVIDSINPTPTGN